MGRCRPLHGRRGLRAGRGQALQAGPALSGYPSPVAALAAELIARPSITPEDGGCQGLLAARLEAAGFACEWLPHGPVTNLWARRGEGPPLLVWLGHTDVVPPGPAGAWTSPPFTPELRDGRLYGRGATDMKGAVAAAVLACERWGAAPGSARRGSLAMLLTSDEEGPARDGTARVIAELTGRGEHIDWCLVGEPSSDARGGDRLRVGRRGSLGARVRILGRQGHVANPQAADNPIHAFCRAFAELAGRRWDTGGDGFPPTSFQISNVHAGTGADNVIPGELEALCNLRYGTASTPERLIGAFEEVLARHALDTEIEWRESARPFATTGGALLEATRASVREVFDLEPELSTGGGTSDGRFVAPTGAEVVELGTCNATAHQVDEHVALDDLDALALAYQRIFTRLLG